MIEPIIKSIVWSDVRVVCLAVMLSAFSVRAAAEEFSNAIHAYLQQCVESRNANIAIVVGIVDDYGNRVVGYGKLDNDTDQDVNGDTVFEIGSDTKTFTALLLQDMVERGEMKLDDPVAMYLPEAVKMPTRNGKEITLRQLATHASGLPNVPDNLDPKRADNPYADYTVEKLYTFLSAYQLSRNPGATSEYSNIGMGLLGHVIARKAGTSYESIVVDRICQPLKMDSTRITLLPELKSRVATGHNQFGEPVPSWDLPTLAGAGALRSTANDMLKYVSANLGLTPSSLSPLMVKTHDHRLAWCVTTDREGTTIISHGGGTGGCRTFPAFDKTRRRGVVVLTNSKGILDAGELGNFLLKSEWQSDRRPIATKINSEVYDAYVGQYQQTPDFASRVAAARRLFLTVPKAAICLLAICSLAVVGVCVWRAGNFRNRTMIIGSAVLILGVAASVITVMSSQSVDAASEPGIGIRREGDRLFAEATGSRSWPIDVLLPPNTGELLPESETRFFERLSGNSITFVRDALGKKTRMTAYHGGGEFVYEKVSDQPPVAAEPLRPRIAIMLDIELLDALVGHYQFAPSPVYPAGMKVKVWREADQLLWQERGENAIPGAVAIYPESESTFFTKLDAARMIFSKNVNREVTAVILQIDALPKLTGKKVAID